MAHIASYARPACVLHTAVLLTLAAWLITPASAQGGVSTPDYEADASWPRPLPNTWLIGQAGGLAVDKHDHIWVNQRPHSLTDDEKGAVPNPPVRTTPR